MASLPRHIQEALFNVSLNCDVELLESVLSNSPLFDTYPPKRPYSHHRISLINVEPANRIRSAQAKFLHRVLTLSPNHKKVAQAAASAASTSYKLVIVIQPQSSKCPPKYKSAEWLKNQWKRSFAPSLTESAFLEARETDQEHFTTPSWWRHAASTSEKCNTIVDAIGLLPKLLRARLAALNAAALTTQQRYNIALAAIDVDDTGPNLLSWCTLETIYPALHFTVMIPDPIVANQTATRRLALSEPTHWIVLSADLLVSLYSPLPF